MDIVNWPNKSKVFLPNFLTTMSEIIDERMHQILEAE
jgi:hypothetical protein